MQNTIHSATALMYILIRAIYSVLIVGKQKKNLRTTPGSDCALTSLAIDEPLEYARLYLDGNLQMWVDAEDSLTLY